MNDFNPPLIDAFRANGGKDTGMDESAPSRLLTTTGAQSGQPRTTPLVGVPDSDRLVIVATTGSAPTSPVWHHNLAAITEVAVELETAKFLPRAEIAVELEHTRCADAVAEVWPLRQDKRHSEWLMPATALSRV